MNCKEKQNKILITGTGRCGTTFLMILFTYLKLDTGFTIDNYEKFIDNGNSGLEKYDYIWEKPYILKNPQYFGDFEKILKYISLDFVIIPLRNYEDSSKSRFKNKLLWKASNQDEQVAWYHKLVAEYVLLMAKYDIPTIFLDFERMISSKEYLFDKLSLIIKDVSFEEFNYAYDEATKHQRKL
jgi:hypothetical protein